MTMGLGGATIPQHSDRISCTVPDDATVDLTVTELSSDANQCWLAMRAMCVLEIFVQEKSQPLWRGINTPVRSMSIT